MKLKRFAVGGLIPFPDPVALDVEALPRGVVVIRGENGEGKSTLLEAGIMGALYRGCPTRGSLAGLAVGPAFAEAVVDLPAGEFTIRQTVEGKRGETSVVGPDGPALAAGKVTEFEAWAAKHLPPEDVALATFFLPQRTAGFLDLPVAERKSLVLRMLGTSRLEAVAREAAVRARAAELLFENADRDLGKRLAAAPSIDEAVGRVAAAHEALREACSRCARASKALDDAKARADALDDAYRNAEAARARRRPIAERDARARTELAALRVRLGSLRTRISEIEPAEGTAERLRAAEAAVVEADRVRDAALEEVRVARAERDRLEACAADRFRERDRLAAVASQEPNVRPGLEAAEAAAAAIPALEAELADARATCGRLEEELHALRLERVNDLGVRTEGLRGGLSKVYEASLRADLLSISDECAWEVAAKIAKTTLDADDALVERARTQPTRELEKQREVDRARGEVESCRRHLEERRAAAARAEPLRERLAEIQRARIEAGDAEEAAAAFRRSRDAVPVPDLSLAAEHAVKECGVRRLCLDAARAAVKAAAEVDWMRATIADAEPREVALAEELVRLEVELSLNPEPGEDAPQPPDLGPAREELEAANRARAEHDRAVGLALGEENAARNAAAEIERLREELGALGEEGADFVLLREAFGPRGIQALEVDAAGPELSELANGFLHECYGPRWTVRLTTTKVKDDGTESEVFDVEVTDSRPDRDRTDSIRWKSGGESVILGEAITLALSTYAARRAGGADGATWVRDESGAALDGPKARAYVAMLRRAAELAGAARVLLVSHSPDVAALADARLCVAAGRVELCSDPCRHRVTS